MEVVDLFPHQKVKAIAFTEPVAESTLITSNDIVAYCARVSSPKNQDNLATAPKLLSYLVRKKHWSPFEMVSATLEIETTRDIARQILRHRSFHFQEMSQRYSSDMVSVNQGIIRESRLQDTKNRQNSIESNDSDLSIAWNTRQQLLWEHATDDYQWAIKQGIAKEQARAVLPEGMTQSRLYMAGTLRDWYHYCQLRMTVGETQKEHVDIANKAWYILCDKYSFLNELT